MQLADARGSQSYVLTMCIQAERTGNTDPGYCRLPPDILQAHCELVYVVEWNIRIYSENRSYNSSGVSAGGVTEMQTGRHSYKYRLSVSR